MKNLSVEFLSWDSDFFNLKVGRVIVDDQFNFEEEIKIEDDQNYDLLYFQSKFKIENWNNIKQDFSIKLVDAKTIFFKEIDTEIAYNESIEEYEDKDASDKLIDLSIQSGVYSRFNIDKNIGKSNFEKLYTIWIEKSVSREIALTVLVYKIKDEIAGFVTLGTKNNRADIGIIAVDSDFRGKGIGKKLMKAAERWFANHGFKTMQVVTQGENTPACKLYQNCGFEVETVDFFYHLWQKKN